MPKAWSDKDERQYEHIKKSAKDKGRSEDRAEKIAARSVNKQRRKEDRTPNDKTEGTGNPNTPLEDRNKEELKNRAQELNVDDAASMNKDELVKAIREKE